MGQSQDGRSNRTGGIAVLKRSTGNRDRDVCRSVQMVCCSFHLSVFKGYAWLSIYLDVG